MFLRRCSAISRLAAIAGVTLFALGFSGCPINGRGTDEASEFKIPEQYTFVNFEILKKEILTPFKCLECHQEFNQESGFLPFLVPGDAKNSRVYKLVANGAMPPPQSGPRLSEFYLGMMSLYINGLNQPSPTPTPGPAPGLEPKWSSLRDKLFSVSCMPCHRANGRRMNLQALGIVKKPENLQQIIQRLESFDPDEVMPPPDANKPAPPAHTADVLREWEKLGFPEE